MEAARTFKANLKLEGRPCGHCQVALALGEDVAVCTACELQHHNRCWETKGGCGTSGCANAPLKRIDPPPPAPAASFGSPFPGGGYAPSGGGYAPSGGGMGPPPPGLMYCSQCRALLPIGAPMCASCRAITSPDGIYHGPRMNAPGAVAALVCGIIGILFCGIILGPIAIAQGSSAKRAIAMDPTLGGGGMATAGLVLGIIGLIFHIIFILLRFGMMS